MAIIEVDGKEYFTGRLEAEDPRDKNHLMQSALVGAPTLIKPRYWRTGSMLDQGRTNSCVGFTCRQWLQTAPIMFKLNSPSGLDIYNRALDIDEFPGNQDTGTSIRAGVKVLQEKGHVERYVWAYSSNEVRDWLIQYGSVIVGTQITKGMAEPHVTNNGEVWMRPTGPQLGGHAYLLVGYSHLRNAFRMVNSWSRNWGDNGRAWIATSDFSDLLVSRGDAVGVVEKKLT